MLFSREPSLFLVLVRQLPAMYSPLSQVLFVLGNFSEILCLFRGFVDITSEFTKTFSYHPTHSPTLSAALYQELEMDTMSLSTCNLDGCSSWHCGCMSFNNLVTWLLAPMPSWQSWLVLFSYRRCIITQIHWLESIFSLHVP
jgi:hypothetical protein